MTHEAAGGSATGDEIVERVWALREFGRYEEALAEARSGVSEHPDDPELLGAVAWIEFFHGDKAVAEQVAKHTLAVRPNDWRGLTVLIEAAVVRGAHDEAETHAREMLASYPEWADAHLARAHVLSQHTGGKRKIRIEREAEIRESLTRALELDPEGIDTLRRASVMYAGIGDLVESADVLQRALALAPDNEELLLVVAHSPDQSEVEGLRVLTGVLAANPQQREAARSLSDRLWSRTTWLATSLLILLAALLLFGYLVFEEGLSTSQYQRRQLAYGLLALGAGWGVLMVRLPSVLPTGYLRRLYRPVWWVWIGIVLTGIVFVFGMFATLAFAARAQPAQYKISGGYIGGLTAFVAVLIVMLLVAELLLVTARAVSEWNNRLYVGGVHGTDDDRAAARRKLRELTVTAGVRGALALFVALVPGVAAGIATRPEAAGAFPVLAVAMGTPPIVALLMAAARSTGRKRQIRRGRSVICTALAIGVSIAGVAAASALAYTHMLENDPPPTPWQLEMREQNREIAENTRELNEAMARLADAAEHDELTGAE